MVDRTDEELALRYILEPTAKRLFEARPHHNPGRGGVRCAPEWDRQPDAIKEVFFREAMDFAGVTRPNTQTEQERP